MKPWKNHRGMARNVEKEVKDRIGSGRQIKLRQPSTGLRREDS